MVSFLSNAIAIYCNIILAKPTLERYIGVKNVKANAGKRNQSYNIVNAIGDKDLRAPRRPNKSKKIIVTLLRIGIIGLKDWLY